MKNDLKKIILILILFSLISGSCTTDCDDCEKKDVQPIKNLTADQKQVIEATNDLSFELLSRLNEKDTDKNLFISPLSISTALSMVLNGAEGETKEAIRTTLQQTGMTDSEINVAYKSLIEALAAADPEVVFAMANSSWYREDLTVKNVFENILGSYYDAEIKSMDTSDPNTVNLINSWIKNKTNGKITDMLDEVPSDAVMYLINAIYYNASWQYRFDKSKTEERPFHLADGTTVNKETMYCDGATIAYYKDNDLQMFDIPYGNGLYSMTILMPYEAAGINTFASNLTFSDLNSYLDESETTTLRLYLPKFKAEYKKTLNEVLSDLGMGIAFSEHADLSGLFEESLSMEISRVLHQALIEVDEDGTEAAAATITEVFTTSVPDGPPVVTSIDKPFVFFIREKTSNTILFTGKLMEP